MSKNAALEQARFYGRMGDPGRAPSLQRAEFELAVEALRAKVVPILETAAAGLLRKNFIPCGVQQCGGTASLTADRKKPALEGRLRFQVHDTFAVLATREPFFWMFTLYMDGELLTARQGRLFAVDDPQAITDIVDAFVSVCCTAAAE